jgi:hypothetical protein
MIGSLVGLRNIDTMSIKQLTNDDDVFFSKNAYEDVDNNEWVELDIETLVQDNEFIQPTMT